ncbi:MAG TPA: helix-turn-helix domain-containing protein [Dehalococcoidia bacterium]|nr:helix-turn-helix domain-containing protein [Dehalococcoidia bacterium]
MTTAVAPVNRRHSDQAFAPRAYRAYQLPDVLNLSRAYVTRLIASGDLPSFTVGSARFVTAAAIDAWIERRQQAGQGA